MSSKIFTRFKSITYWLDNHLTWVFVFVATIAGIYFVFKVTPLYDNDEIVHFPRAYHIQMGHAKAEFLGGSDYGGFVPGQIKKFNDDYREQVQNPNENIDHLREIKAKYNYQKLQDNKHEALSFTSSSIGMWWAYIPSSIGILTARLLNLPLNWYVYLARLSTLSVYVILTYLAIKYIPIGKRFLFVVALLPVSLLQGTTIGLDALVNGLSWLIVALTFAVLAEKLRVTPRLLIIMAASSALLATTKQGYMPIAALPLLIPARLFPFNLKKVWTWRLVFGSGLLLLSLWYLGATAHLAEVIHEVQRPGLNVNAGSQLHFVFQNPLLFMKMVFIQPFTIWAGNIYAGLVGILTNKQIWLPIPLIILLYAIIFITSLHKERAHVAGRDRLYVLVSSLGAFLATFMLINLALYLSFTIVGFDHVEGLQGRYFLPLLPLLGIVLHTAMPRLFLKVSDTFMGLIVYPCLILALIVSAIAIT